MVYRSQKFHYFLLDFCYYGNVILVARILILNNPRYFYVVFALCNGTLMWGGVIWSQTLVFHDLQKQTNVFIHFLPPIVTYTIRWHTEELSTICGNENCVLSYQDFYFSTVAFYVLWQLLYLLKTELLDLKVLEQDKEIMTSLRWLTEKKPHPILIFFRKNNIKAKPIYLLLATQLFITLVVILPVPLFWHYKHLHVSVLIFVFFMAIWNAAGFYFEVLTIPSKSSSKSSENLGPGKKISSSFSRFFGFLVFLSISAFSFFLLYKLFI